LGKEAAEHRQRQFFDEGLAREWVDTGLDTDSDQAKTAEREESRPEAPR
jgi:hypothetical protein